jgi:hypothetical protein
MDPLRLRDLGASIVLGPGVVVPMVVWHSFHTLRLKFPKLSRRDVARHARLCEQYPEAMRALQRVQAAERRTRLEPVDPAINMQRNA